MDDIFPAVDTQKPTDAQTVVCPSFYWKDCLVFRRFISFYIVCLYDVVAISLMNPSLLVLIENVGSVEAEGRMDRNGTGFGAVLSGYYPADSKSSTVQPAYLRN